MKKEEKEAIVWYPVYKNNLLNVIKSSGSSISELRKYTSYSETTIRRQLDNGKMNKQLIWEIASALKVTPLLLCQMICFEKHDTLTSIQAKLLLEYLDNYY